MKNVCVLHEEDDRFPGGAVSVKGIGMKTEQKDLGAGGLSCTAKVENLVVQGESGMLTSEAESSLGDVCPSVQYLWRPRICRRRSNCVGEATGGELAQQMSRLDAEHQMGKVKLASVRVVEA